MTIPLKPDSSDSEILYAVIFSVIWLYFLGTEFQLLNFSCCQTIGKNWNILQQFAPVYSNIFEIYLCNSILNFLSALNATLFDAASFFLLLWDSMKVFVLLYFIHLHFRQKEKGNKHKTLKHYKLWNLKFKLLLPTEKKTIFGNFCWCCENNY